MQYLFLLYSQEANQPKPPKNPAAFADYMAPWINYSKELTEAGAMQGGNALMPVATSKTVSRAKGESVITDGPFAETKEQLGGYYLVDCANLDDALKLAAKCPIVDYGRVEVRPIMELG